MNTNDIIKSVTSNDIEIINCVCGEIHYNSTNTHSNIMCNNKKLICCDDCQKYKDDVLLKRERIIYTPLDYWFNIKK